MVDYKVTVTPDEAIKMSKSITSEPMLQLLQIFNACRDYGKTKYKCDSEAYNFLCALSSVWNAGRVQGIREERARKRSNTK